MDKTTGQGGGENYCYFFLDKEGNLEYRDKADVDIFGREAFFNSEDIIEYWKIDNTNRADYYQLLIRANMLGANKTRIKELINKWRIIDGDCQSYLRHIGLLSETLNGIWYVYSETPYDCKTVGKGVSCFEATCDFFSKAVTVK